MHLLFFMGLVGLGCVGVTAYSILRRAVAERPTLFHHQKVPVPYGEKNRSQTDGR